MITKKYFNNKININLNFFKHKIQNKNKINLF